MAEVAEASMISTEFLRSNLEVKDIKVIKITRLQDGWEAEAEVFEESAFIKSLGLPTRVMDRNIYMVKLDDHLKVQSFERQPREK